MALAARGERHPSVRTRPSGARTRQSRPPSWLMRPEASRLQPLAPHEAQDATRTSEEARKQCCRVRHSACLCPWLDGRACASYSGVGDRVVGEGSGMRDEGAADDTHTVKHNNSNSNSNSNIKSFANAPRARTSPARSAAR